jgi:hypothetical protein
LSDSIQGRFKNLTKKLRRKVMENIELIVEELEEVVAPGATLND